MSLKELLLKILAPKVVTKEVQLDEKVTVIFFLKNISSQICDRGGTMFSPLGQIGLKIKHQKSQAQECV